MQSQRVNKHIRANKLLGLILGGAEHTASHGLVLQDGDKKGKTFRCMR